MRALPTRVLVWAVVWALAGGLLACEPERPPAPRDAPPAAAEDEAAEAPTLAPGTPVVLTYAGDRGAFADTSKVDDVPEGSRGMVRVTLVGGQDPPPGQVWVANLRTPADDGSFALSTVPRDRFEELALGQGLASAVEIPEGLEPPTKPVAAAPGEVIVYKTSWCGVCKKLQAYLDRKGVKYVAKDIEKDLDAAAELQAKAKAHHIRTGSVPVIDVGGELMVGFDRARLEQLLSG